MNDEGWTLDLLKAELDKDRERTKRDAEARGLAQPERVGHLAISMREVAVRSLCAQHGIDRATAFTVLARAELERQEQAADPVAVARHEAELRSQREAQRLVRAVSDADIPVRPEVVSALISGAGLTTKPTQDVHKWLGGPRRVIALLGDMGTGKTVAACAVALAAFKARQSVAYVRETDVIRWAKSGALASEEKLERLRDVDLLIIDELAQALAQDAEQAAVAVAQLVDARVRRGRTVLVGNLTLAQFVTRYGRRCADRIREIGEIHDEYRDKSLRALTAHDDRDEFGGGV